MTRNEPSDKTGVFSTVEIRSTLRSCVASACNFDFPPKDNSFNTCRLIEKNRKMKDSPLFGLEVLHSLEKSVVKVLSGAPSPHFGLLPKVINNILFKYIIY
jgi:hypothetical protein